MERRSEMFEVDEKLESILICAVRYAIGRRTYMVGEVTGFINPLIPRLSNNALYVIRNEITDAETYKNLGDEKIDAPLWLMLRLRMVNELKKRGCETAKRKGFYD